MAAACLGPAGVAEAGTVRLIAGPEAFTDQQGQRWQPAGERLDGTRTVRRRGLSSVFFSPQLYGAVAVGVRRARIAVDRPGRYSVTLYLVDPRAKGSTTTFDVLRVRGSRTVKVRRVTVPGGTPAETLPFHAAFEVPVPGRSLEVRLRALRGRPAVAAIEVQRLGPVSMPGLRRQWHDTFDGAADTAPDAGRWQIQTGSGWGGRNFPELQEYTDKPANVALTGDGRLRLTARRDGVLSSGRPAYTSGRVDTNATFDLTRARVSVRMRTPPGRGFWPIFWAWFDRARDPKFGEVDIAELVGREPRVLRGYVHGTVQSTNPWIYQNGARLEYPEPLSARPHTYEIRSVPGVVEFYVDGRQYGSVSRADLYKTAEWVIAPELRFKLILALTIGGWAGDPDATTPFPARMTIDDVSVWG